ncbi:MAG: HAMP domain-containing histidine kinase [Anaerolineae bacterium]|nr:HAMP domain-containing histidine kinase [Anaerolineae bacterium]
MVGHNPEAETEDTWDVLEILNIFAHDLKNPLAAIRSFIDLMGNAGELNERQAHFANRAMMNVDRIQQMVNELLDYARLDYSDDSGFDVCDLVKVIDYGISMVQDAASRRQIQISLHNASSNTSIWAHPRLLQHVIVNLMSNAVKYNRRDGTVVISVDDDGPYVRIDVADSGIGIPPEKLHKVFDRFFRVHSDASQNVEGTGLGLAVVKGIVEKHNGRISAQSTLGVGSTFTVLLPALEQAASTSYDSEGREPLDAIDDKAQESQERKASESSADDV